MLPVKNTLMYLAIMCQPVEDGSYKASNYIIVGRYHQACNRMHTIAFECECECVILFDCECECLVV